MATQKERYNEGGPLLSLDSVVVACAQAYQRQRLPHGVLDFGDGVASVTVACASGDGSGGDRRAGAGVGRSGDCDLHVLGTHTPASPARERRRERGGAGAELGGDSGSGGAGCGDSGSGGPGSAQRLQWCHGDVPQNHEATAAEAALPWLSVGERLLRHMLAIGERPSLVAYSSLINGFAQAGEVAREKALFQEMLVLLSSPGE